MAEIVRFPGAGTPAPGAPRVPPVDLDGIGDRYTAYAEAVAAGDGPLIRLLAMACADDIPAMQAELIRVERLRQELADELDRLAGLPCADRHRTGGLR